MRGAVQLEHRHQCHQGHGRRRGRRPYSPPNKHLGRPSHGLPARRRGYLKRDHVERQSPLRAGSRLWRKGPRKLYGQCYVKLTHPVCNKSSIILLQQEQEVLAMDPRTAAYIHACHLS